MKNIYRFFSTAAAAAAILTASACAGSGVPSNGSAPAGTRAVTAPETTTTTAPEVTTAAAVTETSKSEVTSVLPVVIPDETGEGGTEIVVSGSGIAGSGDITAELPVTIDGQDTGEVEVYNSNGIMLASADADSEEDTSEYRNSVFIVSVDPDTAEETVTELFDRLGLSVIYDYESFSMYAVSVSEPLDAEGTKELIEKLESNDFILMAEPDSVVYPDDAGLQ